MVSANRMVAARIREARRCRCVAVYSSAVATGRVRVPIGYAFTNCPVHRTRARAEAPEAVVVRGIQ